MAGKILSTHGKKLSFSVVLFSKGIISPLLAASALKMTAFSPLVHMHRVLVSLHLTVLINVKKSVLSAVRNTAVIVLSRIGSVPRGSR